MVNRTLSDSIRGHAVPMTKWGIRFGGLIACMGAAWQPATVRAADEDTQFWIYAVAKTDLGDATELTVDGTARWREQRRGDEQQTLRFNIDRALSDTVKLGGGFGVFEAGGATELRPHQQLTMSAGRFTFRTRTEQRFFDGADRVELRFRQRVRYTQPLGEGWKASIDGEYFNLVQTRNRDPNAARDQLRGRLIVTHSFSDTFSVAAAYLYIYTPQPGRTDQVNHVPQAIITKRF